MGRPLRVECADGFFRVLSRGDVRLADIAPHFGVGYTDVPMAQRRAERQLR